MYVVAKELFDIKVKIEISIPIIGDMSISKIKPPNGFEFKIEKFDEYEYKDKMINGKKEVLMDFEEAIHLIDSEKCVLTLYLKTEKICKSEYAANSIGALCNDGLNPTFDSIKNSYEKELIKYFSLLHLYKEGDIAWKYSFYKLTTGEGIVTCTEKTDTVCADMLTLNLNPMVIDDEDIESVNRCLEISKGAYEILKYNALSDLEYTYHILDNTTNYKNLMSALENLFIKANERDSKSRKLSKRIPLFLEKDYDRNDDLSKKIRRMYDKRSAAVHANKKISQDDLNELRKIVRECIKEYFLYVEKKRKSKANISFKEMRSCLINQLKKSK